MHSSDDVLDKIKRGAPALCAGNCYINPEPSHWQTGWGVIYNIAGSEAYLEDEFEVRTEATGIYITIGSCIPRFHFFQSDTKTETIVSPGYIWGSGQLDLGSVWVSRSVYTIAADLWIEANERMFLLRGKSEGFPLQKNNCECTCQVL